MMKHVGSKQMPSLGGRSLVLTTNHCFFGPRIFHANGNHRSSAGIVIIVTMSLPFLPKYEEDKLRLCITASERWKMIEVTQALIVARIT
jgi:hypothetical protein